MCVTFPLLSTYFIEPFLSGMFHITMPAIIGPGNLTIMVMMLILMALLPIAVRFLPISKNNTYVHSYMGGVNTGDDRSFTAVSYTHLIKAVPYFQKILVPALLKGGPHV